MGEERKSSASGMVRKIILAVIAVIVILLVFQAGILVGYRKAGFSYRNGDNYYRLLAGGRHGPLDMLFMDFSDAHGAVGKIIKINLPTLTVEDRSGVEKTVTIESETIIKRGLATIKPTALKTGDSVLIIGEPTNSASIEARLIRTLPPLSYATSTNATSTNQ